MSHNKTKPNKISVRPAKTQISQSSLCTEWVANDPSCLHADSKDSDQNGQMPRLIWVFAGRTLILLVLSCPSSNGLHHSFISLKLKPNIKHMLSNFSQLMNCNRLVKAYWIAFSIGIRLSRVTGHSGRWHTLLNFLICFPMKYWDSSVKSILPLVVTCEITIFIFTGSKNGHIMNSGLKSLAKRFKM